MTKLYELKIPVKETSKGYRGNAYWTSNFYVIGSTKDVKFGKRFAVARAPYPYFDTKGSPIEFGDCVTISSGVYIHTHSHHFDKADWRNMDKVVYSEPTIIDDGVFIGVNAQIMPSCKYIGKHSVIAAGAIVVKNVPDCEIWGGNPARRIGGVSV